MTNLLEKSTARDASTTGRVSGSVGKTLNEARGSRSNDWRRGHRLRAMPMSKAFEMDYHSH